MPRAPRIFVDGAVYHVYARLARGERIFADGGEASRLVEILREVKGRDGLTVLAWCAMPTHYHVALRTSSVALWRSMRLVQWRFAREHNRRRHQLGPVWQGRYQVRMVEAERYLLQLIAYIHLNPVAAGLVDDPAEYRWSGHRELLGHGSPPLVDADATLVLFGDERSRARRAYVRMLRGEREQPWAGEGVGRLPWWAGEAGDLDGRAWHDGPLPQAEHLTERDASRDADEYLRRACAAVGVGCEALAGRSKPRELARARELIAVVGVERYGVQVTALARALGMHLGSVSRWITRAAARRQEDVAFASRCEELEHRLGRP